VFDDDAKCAAEPIHPATQLDSLAIEKVAKLGELPLAPDARLGEGGRTNGVTARAHLALLNLQFDVAVRKKLFGDGEALLPGLEPNQFDGVCLEESMQLLILTPEGINIRRAN
jgi:hypothetical protein